MATTVRKKFNYKVVLALIIDLLLIGTTGVLIYYILKLNGIETFLRISFSVAYTMAIILIFLSVFKSSKNKKKKLKYVFMVFISLILIGINTFSCYSLNKVFSTLNKVSKKEETVSVSLLTLKKNNTKLEEINKTDKIGTISSESAKETNDLVEEFKRTNNISNEMTYYENYFELMDALVDGKIKYIFFPTDYESILSSQEEYDDIDNKVVILKTLKKTTKLKQEEQKKVTEPFTVLFMGVDTLTSTYNADTLLVVTFNPNTLSTTMLSIPRDTYTTVSCTGRKHKINSSGWGGDKCVVKTIEDYLDVDIDYYAKINFKGVVDLVNLLGGIDVDVPYSFCEQNSQRKWGKNTVYVEKGNQHLNGEQALALTRNRHYWNQKCAKKYTTEGNRSDFTRGQNQQLVFKSMLNKMKGIDSIETVYKMLDSLGENMVTNMSTNTMLSLYNVGKDILIKLSGGTKDISQIISIKKLKFTSYTTTIKVGNLNLSMVVNYDESVKAVTKAMKVNLGLEEAEVIKSIEFDANDSYKATAIGSNVYGSKNNITTLPNFVGKTYSYAESWAEINKITMTKEFKYTTDSKYSEGEVMEQSVKANTDVSTINKIKIVVATKVDKNNDTPKKFSYSQCLEESEKDNSKCMVKNFVGSDISSFKSWLSETGLNINVEYNTVSGETSKIVGQNISGIDLYTLINENKTLEITYSVKESAEEKTEDNNN